MGDGVSSPYEGFFVMGYVEELPRSSMHPEGIVLHFEPERHPCTAFYIACQAKEDRVLAECLENKIFDFDGRKAVPFKLEGVFGFERYAVIPGREKSLPHLRELYRERVKGVEFTPLPQIFETMEDYREFLRDELATLQRLQGNIQSAPWYNSMLDDLRSEIEDAYLRHDADALKQGLRRRKICFPWDHSITDEIVQATVTQDTDAFIRLLEQV